MADFKGWPKTPRFTGLTVTITEKIDGTNSCFVVEDGEIVLVQSRNRVIKPGDDNFGFAFWVHENKEDLSKMGDGYHYGEWAGPGIQKNPHELEEKTFFYFNTFRPQETLPPQIKQVPILYQGEFSNTVLDRVMDELANGGSVVGPGKAEGVIIYFHDSRHHMKYTFNNNQEKWRL